MLKSVLIFPFFCRLKSLLSNINKQTHMSGTAVTDSVKLCDSFLHLKKKLQNYISPTCSFPSLVKVLYKIYCSCFACYPISYTFFTISYWSGTAQTAALKNNIKYCPIVVNHLHSKNLGLDPSELINYRKRKSHL